MSRRHEFFCLIAFVFICIEKVRLHSLCVTLIVDTDAVLALAVALKRFEAIAGQVQIKERGGRVKLVEPYFNFAIEPGEGFDPFPSANSACVCL